MGSLAGAARLLNDNAGVPRRALWRRKCHFEQKGKSLLELHLQQGCMTRKRGLSIGKQVCRRVTLLVSEKLPKG
jgi:hypothetical protein